MTPTNVALKLGHAITAASKVIFVVINGEKETYQGENAIQTKESRSKHREVPFLFYYYSLENSYNV